MQCSHLDCESKNKAFNEMWSAEKELYEVMQSNAHQNDQWPIPKAFALHTEDVPICFAPMLAT